MLRRPYTCVIATWSRPVAGQFVVLVSSLLGETGPGLRHRCVCPRVVSLRSCVGVAGCQVRVVSSGRCRWYSKDAFYDVRVVTFESAGGRNDFHTTESDGNATTRKRREKTAKPWKTPENPGKVPKDRDSDREFSRNESPSPGTIKMRGSNPAQIRPKPGQNSLRSGFPLPPVLL